MRVAGHVQKGPRGAREGPLQTHRVGVIQHERRPGEVAPLGVPRNRMVGERQRRLLRILGEHAVELVELRGVNDAARGIYMRRVEADDA